ncbi:hypothetical protein EVAR_69795_1 [Eumeta japonica]|uniref:Uncharacterized protein n=1 Tax=Eumeta variegata TaxID=151549 RepID=A0A4C1SBT2_EUMVA|nr:hypothetical protein EVAR_69795_1 [Eumeta japonica]
MSQMLALVRKKSDLILKMKAFADKSLLGGRKLRTAVKEVHKKQWRHRCLDKWHSLRKMYDEFAIQSPEISSSLISLPCGKRTCGPLDSRQSSPPMDPRNLGVITSVLPAFRN